MVVLCHLLVVCCRQRRPDSPGGQQLALEGMEGEPLWGRNSRGLVGAQPPTEEPRTSQLRPFPRHWLVSNISEAGRTFSEWYKIRWVQHMGHNQVGELWMERSRLVKLQHTSDSKRYSAVQYFCQFILRRLGTSSSLKNFRDFARRQPHSDCDAFLCWSTGCCFLCAVLNLLFFSFGGKNPRKEILHNIDPLHGSSGESLFPDIYDIRVRSALRVGDWKLLTGSPGERNTSFQQCHRIDAPFATKQSFFTPLFQATVAGLLRQRIHSSIVISKTVRKRKTCGCLISEWTPLKDKTCQRLILMWCARCCSGSGSIIPRQYPRITRLLIPSATQRFTTVPGSRGVMIESLFHCACVNGGLYLLWDFF